MLGDEYRPDALTQPATGGVVTEVSQNPNAIGYIGFAYLDSSIKALSLDKGNGSVTPTAESILSGAYPLSRALFTSIPMGNPQVSQRNSSTLS